MRFLVEGLNSKHLKELVRELFGEVHYSFNNLKFHSFGFVLGDKLEAKVELFVIVWNKVKAIIEEKDLKQIGKQLHNGAWSYQMLPFFYPFIQHFQDNYYQVRMLFEVPDFDRRKKTNDQNFNLLLIKDLLTVDESNSKINEPHRLSFSKLSNFVFL